MRRLELAGIGAGLLGGFLLGREAKQPKVLYRRVEVPVETIREIERVDTVITWRERVIYRTVPAERVATAPGGAVEDVGAFSAEAVAAALDSAREARKDLTPGLASPRTEIVAPRAVYGPPRLLLRSVRVEPG